MRQAWAIGAVAAVILGLGSAMYLVAQQAAPGGGPENGLNIRPPNGAGQRPAFAGQTRAPEQKLGVPFDVVTVADGLAYPWSLAFLPDGKMLVTERPGRLRVLSADGKQMSAAAAPVVAAALRDGS